MKECTYIVPLLCKRALVHRWASWSLFIPNLLGREPFPLEESRGWGGSIWCKMVNKRREVDVMEKEVKENRPIDVGGERSLVKKVKLTTPAFF